jgi:EmrB/QacA subfamily drug resistance transporter
MYNRVLPMKKVFSPRNLILIALMIAYFMLYLDATILPVSLPTIQRLFHSSPEQLQWMINSYLLALSIFIALSGKISDIFGHRKIFVLGLGIFGLFSLFCSLSQNNMQLIVSRFFQGMGGALMISSASPLQIDCFPENIRGKILGINATAGSVAFTIGPMLGGFITQYFSWHYIFLINIPIAIIGMVVGFYAIPKSKKKEEKIDFQGAFSFMIAIFCLTMALMEGKNFGWSSLTTLTLFSFSLIFFLALYFSDKKSKNPFMDFSFFKNKIFFFALVAIFVTSLVRMMAFFWVIYFQNVLDFSPIFAGTLESISVLPMLFLSSLIGKFVDLKGSRVSMILGEMIMIVSFLLLVVALPFGNIPLISIGLLTLGIGITLTMIPSYSSGLSSAPQQKRGFAGGILNSFRNIASSLGIALLGAIFINTQESLFSSHLEKIPETKNLDPSLFEGLLSKATHALEALKPLPPDIQNIVRSTLKSSFSWGINLANLFAVFLLLLALILVISSFWPRKRKEKIPYEEIAQDQL